MNMYESLNKLTKEELEQRIDELEKKEKILQESNNLGNEYYQNFKEKHFARCIYAKKFDCKPTQEEIDEIWG